MNDKSNAALAIEKVTIDGDEIWVLPAGPDAPEIPGRTGQRVRGWVVVARLCEPFLLAPQRQQEKLESAPWACTTIMVALDGRSQNRPLFCLNVEAVPMWLATLTPGKVNESVREKLARYQVQASVVLDDWANGRSRIVRADDNHLLQAVLQLGEGVAEIGHGVTALLEDSRQTKQELVLLGSGQKHLTDRVTKLEEQARIANDAKRKNPSKQTVADHIRCARWSGGTCSCCQDRSLFDDSGEFSGHIDHAIKVSDADSEATWPVCPECNERLKVPAFRQERDAEFKAYQRRLKLCLTKASISPINPCCHSQMASGGSCRPRPTIGQPSLF
jgi:hypothetical protein